MARKKEQLIRLIRSSFAKRLKPVDDCIANNGEYELQTGRFRGKDWKQISAHFIAEDHQALFFLSAEGYCYYLPAWMISCLKFPKMLGTALDSLLFSMTPSKQEGREKAEWVKVRVERLSAAQRASVLAFLTYLSSDPDPYVQEKAGLAAKAFAGI